MPKLCKIAFSAFEPKKSISLKVEQDRGVKISPEKLNPDPHRLKK